MSKPVLLIIAGCNGSGKSTFSKPLAPEDFTPFDYDYHFLKFYNSLIDSDIKEAMAHRMAFNELENQIKNAIDNKLSFCYETNFNSTPLHWPELFKSKGYDLHLIFLCLNSIQEAKKRVAIRVENGGHFVPENEIEKRYNDGYDNLNSFFDHFDYIDLFDSSKYSEHPTHALSIESGKVSSITNIPDYLKFLIPNIITRIK
ncbi:zeta toxin family protein [Flavobacterium sp. MC2016-06]|jgi:predicted ABC-type ATPase|uniref:zeta toxin family protein n=1 Tax=Flavobacterium sp. MC2016-06 TaxID=2676308 RepID=UPI0012BAC121|nr:zeta toxin family protein [Flavobacterium sp. MC2016-06]MBU3859133.1 zeta toxin family protein [Flavobacterium sp. MC2016-06]